MLVLKDIFERTWGKSAEPDGAAPEFWACAIDNVRARYPAFTFIAETYWGLEERLQLLGFDYTYHKTMYDVMVRGSLVDIRSLLDRTAFLERSLFFVENHDEPRIAAAIPDCHRRRASVVCAFTLPGARLVHDGQIEGKTTRHPVQFGRQREETVDDEEHLFYRTLFAALCDSAVGKGMWRLIENRPVEWNPGSGAALLAFLWEAPDGRRDLVVVNCAPQERETRMLIRFQGVAGRQWELRGRLSGKCYARDGDQLCGEGLYVRLGPYEADIFQIVYASTNHSSNE
jgi:hypothetical protein